MNEFRIFAFAALVGSSAMFFSALQPAWSASDQTMPTCAAGDAVVWENTSSKVYHLKGDKYFGTTKHGQYACKSDADKAGYHQSKSGSSKSSSSSSGGANAESAAPSPMASPASSSKHHHKHGSLASPSPTST